MEPVTPKYYAVQPPDGGDDCHEPAAHAAVHPADDDDNGDRVQLPNGVPEQCVSPDCRVFTDFAEAHRIIKAWKGCRFKCFGDRQSAVEFARRGSPSAAGAGGSGTPPSTPIRSPLPHSPAAGGHPSPGLVLSESPNNRGSVTSIGSPVAHEIPASPFAMPKLADRTPFRRAIEQSNMPVFWKYVESNPLFLIDVEYSRPTILFIGTNAHALWIACDKDKLEPAKAILSLMRAATSNEPDNIVQRAAPNNSPHVNCALADILLDAFLNQPDKTACTTPLHKACRNGSAEMVRLLVSFDRCRVDVVNKFGETPADMTLKMRERLKMEEPAVYKSTKKEIKGLLVSRDQRFYVPLYRPDDDSTCVPQVVPPVSGRPQMYLRSGDLKRAASADSGASVAEEPSSAPIYRLAAFVGPFADVRTADAFYKDWCDKSFMKATRLTDMSKGMERCGRALAGRHSVGFVEFWPFLLSGGDERRCYADLSTQKGLDSLEAHLAACQRALEGTDEQTQCDGNGDAGGANDSVRQQLNLDDSADIEDAAGGSATTGDDSLLADLMGRVRLSDTAPCNDDSDEVFEDASPVVHTRSADSFGTPPSSPRWLAYVDGAPMPSRRDYDVLNAAADALAAAGDEALVAARWPHVARWWKCVRFYDARERRSWHPVQSPRVDRKSLPRARASTSAESSHSHKAL